MLPRSTIFLSYSMAMSDEKGFERQSLLQLTHQLNESRSLLLRVERAFDALNDGQTSDIDDTGAALSHAMAQLHERVQLLERIIRDRRNERRANVEIKRMDREAAVEQRSLRVVERAGKNAVMHQQELVADMAQKRRAYERRLADAYEKQESIFRDEVEELERRTDERNRLIEKRRSERDAEIAQRAVASQRHRDAHMQKVLERKANQETQMASESLARSRKEQLSRIELQVSDAFRMKPGERQEPTSVARKRRLSPFENRTEKYSHSAAVVIGDADATTDEAKLLPPSKEKRLSWTTLNMSLETHLKNAAVAQEERAETLRRKREARERIQLSNLCRMEEKREAANDRLLQREVQRARKHVALKEAHTSFVRSVRAAHACRSRESPTRRSPQSTPPAVHSNAACRMRAQGVLTEATRLLVSVL